MTRLALLAALLAQEPAPGGVEGDLAGKVDEKNPAAAFEALAALVALPPERRAEVAAAAEKLPPFYKDVLRSELKLRDALGEHFGKEVRVTLKGESRTAVGHLGEITKQTGLRIEPGYGLRERAGDPFALDLQNATFMAALADLCARTKQYPMMYNSPHVTLNPSAMEVRSFCYRNFGLFLTNVSFYKKVNFGGPAPWTCQFWCMPIADPGVKVVSWKSQTRVLEAVTDKGVRLEGGRHDAPSAIQHADDDPLPPGAARNASCTVLLQIPGTIPEKLARLRLVATAVVARATRDYAVTRFGGPEKAKAEDDLFEVAVPETEGGQPYQPEITVLVRPKKLMPAELVALPVGFEVKYKDAGDGQTWFQTKTVDGAVEYRVRWWPFNYGNPRDNKRVLESVKISIPTDVVDRPLYAEFTDIPLK